MAGEPPALTAARSATSSAALAITSSAPNTSVSPAPGPSGTATRRVSSQSPMIPAFAAAPDRSSNRDGRSTTQTANPKPATAVTTKNQP